MWSETLAKASNVRAPQAANADDENFEITLDVSGTAVRVEVPDWLKGKYAEFTATDANVDILFGGSAVEVVYSQANSVASEVIAQHDNVGRRVISGTTRSWVVPSDATHMSCEASASGELSIGLASAKIEK